MRRFWPAVTLFLSLLTCPVFASPAAEPLPEDPLPPVTFEYTTALNTSQKAIGEQLGDYPVTDINGQQLNLAELRGKPMVLSLIFTSCHQICPMTTRHLAKVIDKARSALGHDSFSVVAIGFDTAVDTPEAMRYFAKQQGIENSDWKLFSIGAEEVASLTRDLGFLYYPSARGFDHLIQATVIDSEGVVYRQVYGQVFETPLLVEPLKDLVLGRPQPSQTFISDLFNKIRFFCTTYDPVRDGYYFDYSLFVGLFIGVSIIVFISVWMVKEIRYRRRYFSAQNKPS